MPSHDVELLVGKSFLFLELSYMSMQFRIFTWNLIIDHYGEFVQRKEDLPLRILMLPMIFCPFGDYSTMTGWLWAHQG